MQDLAETAYRLLVINPGSTSTKIAVFEDERVVVSQTLRHKPEELAQFKNVEDQYGFRKHLVLEALKTQGIRVDSLHAVVGRGGLLKPVPGGVFRIGPKMIEELRASAYGRHASNLAALIAYEIAQECGIPSFVVDPVVVDELEPVARLSGLPEITRRSAFHALNQRAVARRAAAELGLKYNESHLIVAHLGGGITVGAHRHGRVIDVNNGIDGEGPFTPERAGALPVIDLIGLCFSGQFTEAALRKKIMLQGGLMAYLGTTDATEVEAMIRAGNQEAALFYEAMAYQVAKEIGAAATVLKGEIDAVVLTGGLAYSSMLVGWIKERVAFLGKILVYPGENEMEALAGGVLRVLRGQEQAMDYT
ncbi:MAG: butyrate kinase [Syntrophothermus sp.]